jgi:cold-inducible RNA-binding protein
MNKKLFVGGIPFTSTEEAIKALFSQAGNVVSATIIFDKMSGRSKGFGFVEMETEEEAQKAIEMFNGTEFEGRQISVNEAKPLEDRPPRSFGGGDSYGGNRSGGYRNDRAPRRDFDR